MEKIDLKSIVFEDIVLRGPGSNSCVKDDEVRIKCLNIKDVNHEINEHGVRIPVTTKRHIAYRFTLGNGVSSKMGIKKGDYVKMKWSTKDNILLLVKSSTGIKVGSTGEKYGLTIVVTKSYLNSLYLVEKDALARYFVENGQLVILMHKREYEAK